MKKTFENLIKAFIGESQARNRYSYYAKQAQKEGFEQIAGIFLETAEQEKTHAKRLFEHIQELRDGEEQTEINGALAPLVLGSTEENLTEALNGETYEYTEMYPEFAKIAEEEGLGKIASRFKNIAKAEAHHAERYQKLLKNLQEGAIFKKKEKTIWVCRECGYVHEGDSAPTVCPSCDHPQAYYQIKSENY